MEDAQKIHVYIDEGNVWSIYKSAGKTIDWNKFKKYLQGEFKPTEIFFYFYGCYRKNDEVGKHKFFTFLRKGLNFNVIKKKLKKIEREDGTTIEKGNMDVEISRDITYHAHYKDLSTIILCSGDSDFSCLAPMIKRRGVRLIILSSKNTISHELKSSADKYTDLMSIEEIWGNDLVSRPK